MPFFSKQTVHFSASMASMAVLGSIRVANLVFIEIGSADAGSPRSKNFLSFFPQVSGDLKDPVAF